MSAPAPPPPPGRWARLFRLARAHRGKSLLLGLAALALIGLGCMDVLLARPMQRWAERTMNANLKGYTVKIGRVRPHLWRFAFDLDDLVLRQTTHPDPPVADFGALKFSLLIPDLLRFKVAGNLTLVRPALHIDLAQIEEEVRSHVGLKGRGWQKAVESIFPFKLDQVQVQDGSVLYRSRGATDKPIQITRIHMVTTNVRNIAVSKSTFPSPVTMEGVLFDTGKVWFKGAADFLREPYAAARGELHLEQVPLDRLSPLAQSYQVKTKGGLLSLQGSVEYTPEAHKVHVAEVVFDHLHVNYVTSRATKSIEKEHAEQVIKLAERVRNAPKLWLEVDSLKLRNSQLGVENLGATPPYQVFISSLNLNLEHLSNQIGLETSLFHAQGAFMGSGQASLSGKIRSTAKPVDFDLRLQVEEAKLPALNGLLKAHLGLDVAEGLISVYTEIKVKNGQVEGYIKPLVKNLKIYDRQKDQGKPYGKRVKLHVLQFLANLLKNRESKEVATVIRISGATGGPQANEWEVIRKLIANGLAHAILPGFQPDPKTVPPPPPPAPKPVSH
ncbi:DUF748 domain-containing protein [Geothrix fuzhouensis]|uniref:DUF748 domain-containing protein n=1 Tax=Geothrix fuzhouensis TaxID=2966451 RepID=UPI002148AFBA|nr:DUF748 domain-containing protein [Geothrix fuzhouensis]